MVSDQTFEERLLASIEAKRSILCVDLKLDRQQIERVHKDLSGYDSGPEGHLELYSRFSERALGAIAQGKALAVRLRPALYLPFGMAGLRVLRNNVEQAHALDLLVILEVEDAVQHAIAAVLECDALVVSTPLSMAAPLPHQVEEPGVGTFVVNHPHLGQRLWTGPDGLTLREWEHKAIEINARPNLGVCVTATTREFVRLRELLPNAWFLVEERDNKLLAGVDAVLGVNSEASGVIVNYSHGILYRESDIRGLTALANLSLNHGLSVALKYLKTI